MNNILILYISEYGGHSKAAKNIKEALEAGREELRIKNINGFGHFYPLGEKIVDYMYTKVIRHIPQLWGGMYDRKPLVQNLNPFRKAISVHTFKKLKILIDDFNPHCIVTTQAFPCGIVADYKAKFGLSAPLIAVVTDYYPHRFWVHQAVDHYVVACEEAKRILINEGIASDKINILGIPVSIQFMQSYQRNQVMREMGFVESLPVVLIMGGGLGLGPIEYVAQQLDMLEQKFQLVVVCGKNRKLYDWFSQNKQSFKRPLFCYEYITTIPKIMDCVDIIITKAGGITVSEALAKGLAIVITDPIPGQEERNTSYLLKQEAVVAAENCTQVAGLVKDLFETPSRLQKLRARARQIATADSSAKIAQLVTRSIQ